MTNNRNSYNILKFPPAYLDGYLAINGCLSEYCIPIEFTNSKGEKWVYGFKGEIEKEIEIINLENNQYFLISTINQSNTKYIVDIEKTNPIFEIEFISEIFNWNNQYILISDSRNLIAVIQNPKKIKFYENLCWDGIKQNKIENGILKGLLYDWEKENKFKKTKYELDLKTLILKKGKELEEKPIQTKKTPTKKSKWWKIWKVE